PGPPLPELPAVAGGRRTIRRGPGRRGCSTHVRASRCVRSTAGLRAVCGCGRTAAREAPRRPAEPRSRGTEACELLRIRCRPRVAAGRGRAGLEGAVYGGEVRAGSVRAVTDSGCGLVARCSSSPMVALSWVCCPLPGRWQVTAMRSMLIDDCMPHWSVRERHARVVRASAGDAFAGQQTTRG